MLEILGYPLEIERRPYQRSINVIVRINSQIKVTTSLSAKDKQIFQFLMAQKDWIEKTQASYKKIRDQHPEKKFEEGELFPFRGLGKELRFHVTVNKRIKWQVEGNQLNCFLPEKEITNTELKKSLQSFYKKKAVDILDEKIKLLSERMKLYPSSVSYRSQKTRWGSCSSRGQITLNWRLVAAPDEVIDYVIIHELAHLKHQNHSSRFWSLVEEYCTDYEDHKRWLRKNQYDFDFLAKKSELYI